MDINFKDWIKRRIIITADHMKYVEKHLHKQCAREFYLN